MKTKGFTLIEAIVVVAIIIIIAAIIAASTVNNSSNSNSTYKITIHPEEKVFILKNKPSQYPEINYIKFINPETGSEIITTNYTIEEIIQPERNY